MRFPPTGLFGAVMGLVGLGLAARAAAPLFPGVFRAPAYVTEPWIAAGTLLFVVLGLLFFAKVVTGKAKADFVAPERMGALGLIAVSMMLIAAGMAPYQPALADLLWWKALVLYGAGLAWGLVRLAQLGLGTRALTPSWIVLLVGGIVLPAGGIPLGHEALCRWVFCIALLAGLLLVVPLATRPPLPPPLRPGWFILLAPPALVAVHGQALFQHPAFSYALYVAIAVLAALLYFARGIWRWPVNESVWSLTFPLDAFALAASRQALREQSEAWRAVAACALVLAALAVVFSLYRTIVRRSDARVQ
jgi:tellurite resistance protein TehA-like permease